MDSQKVCILSDTHGFLDPRILPFLDDCVEVWHAGDFGGLEIADQLKARLPLRGVYGNIDGPEVRREYPEALSFTFAGVKVSMLHIGGKPGKYPAQARALLTSEKPDLYICGHSHIMRAMPDPKYNTFHLNPGACGNQGFHDVKTIVFIHFSEGKMARMEVAELGLRGR